MTSVHFLSPPDNMQNIFLNKERSIPVKAETEPLWEVTQWPFSRCRQEPWKFLYSDQSYKEMPLWLPWPDKKKKKHAINQQFIWQWWHRKELWRNQKEHVTRNVPSVTIMKLVVYFKLWINEGINGWMKAAVLFPGDVLASRSLIELMQNQIISKQEHRFIHDNRRSVAIIKLTQVHSMPLIL